MTKRKNRPPAHQEDVRIGNDDLAADDVVEIRRTDSGAALIVPRSIGRLGDEAAEAVAAAQHAVATIQRAQRDLDRAVADARAAGASWAAVGWSVGTTGEAARQRWGTSRT